MSPHASAGGRWRRAPDAPDQRGGVVGLTRTAGNWTPNGHHEQWLGFAANTGKARLCGPFLESGRQDLNLRPPGPQPGALPDCATPRGRRR